MLISVTAYSQDTLTSIKLSDLGEPHDFSYQKNWVYFKLKNDIVVEIIYHLPAQSGCGVNATASMTIAKTKKGETIRILDLCNTWDNYIKGQFVKITPATKPSFGVSTPFTLKENPETKKFEPSKFDLTILKTTWGSLPEK